MDHDETKATLESISEYWDDRSGVLTKLRNAFLGSRYNA